MAVLVLCLLAVNASAATTVVHVSDQTLITGVIPFGLNISGPEPYGANQILNNIIPNPGFEDGVYGMVFHADEGATGRRVPQAFWDAAWNNDAQKVGQPAGFWDGAAYEIVYGPAKGRRGKIKRFTIESNKPVYYLDSDGVAPAKWDVLFVRRTSSGINANATTDTTTTRPGSPGKQSLRLRYNDEWRPAYACYADSVWRDSDRSAGKLFLVRGDWRLEFWAKSKRAGQQVLAVFKREGESQFLHQTFTLTTAWKKYEAAFTVPPDADVLPAMPGENRGILMFAFYVPKTGSEIWVDDASLSRSARNSTGFTDSLVDRLKEFKPGVLRFWAEQLGDALDNQLAQPFARRPHGYRPHSREAWMYTYSLPEFLELCRASGAEPWYVIPPTFSPDDLAKLIAYLAAPPGQHQYAEVRGKLGQIEPWTSVFNRIHLEYGNEMWGAASGNDPFMGASALGGERYAEIANDRLGIVRASPFYDPQKFCLIAGGQTFAPPTQTAITSKCQAADCIAFAPYFGVLDEFGATGDLYGPLFASPFFQILAGPMRQNADILRASAGQPGMALYELNFGTTEGAAPEDIRNGFVAGGAGAIALPLAMLLYQRDLGATRQCAFTNAQFSFRAGNGQNVRLWGLLRDIESTGRKRPTWLGLELVNSVVSGDALKTQHEGESPSWVQRPINGIENEITVDELHSFAFRDGISTSVVLFNLSLTESRDILLAPSQSPSPTAIHRWIAPIALDQTNEDQERVKIEQAELKDFGPDYSLRLPPHSVHVLTWQQASPPAPPQQ